MQVLSAKSPFSNLRSRFSILPFDQGKNLVPLGVMGFQMSGRRLKAVHDRKTLPGVRAEQIRLAVPALHAYSAGMKGRKKIVYTLRDVPNEADSRVREVAAAEEVSLNTALLRLIERGLGGDSYSIPRRRDLRHLVDGLPAANEREWRAFLASTDVVDQEKWK
jgi:hypothetical protein